MTFKEGDLVRARTRLLSPLATEWQGKEGRVYMVQGDFVCAIIDGCPVTARSEEWEAVETRCPGCHREIDPDVCGCGEYLDRRHPSAMNCGHSPIPMGCVCLTAEHARERAKAVLDDLAALADS